MVQWLCWSIHVVCYSSVLHQELDRLQWHSYRLSTGTGDSMLQGSQRDILCFGFTAEHLSTDMQQHDND